MNYALHDILKASMQMQFAMAAQGNRLSAAFWRAAAPLTLVPQLCEATANYFTALETLIQRSIKSYDKVGFNFMSTKIDGQTVPIHEEAVVDKPYGRLLHFKRESVTPRNDPKVLIVTPLSGHHATLMKDTVKALLPHHDVYITDWEDGRNVPRSAGEFGLEEYIGYVQDFLHAIGPNVHTMSLSQSTVPLTAAAALMGAEKDACRPLSMTLMAGPVDPRAGETEVSRFGTRYPLEWYNSNMLADVPAWYEGHGQRVYPGYIVLAALMNLDHPGHTRAMFSLFEYLRNDDKLSAQEIMDKYDEFKTVLDVPGKLYLDTIHHVYQKNSLPSGTLTWKGRTVDTLQIHDTALFTVEGGMDTITGPGQTMAAQLLCRNLPADMKFSHTDPYGGHYSLFHGKTWREDVMPRFAGFVREMAAKRGISYDPGAETTRPAVWNQNMCNEKTLLLHGVANDNHRSTPKRIEKQGPSPLLA